MCENLKKLMDTYLGSENLQKEGELEKNKLDIKGVFTKRVNWCFHLEKNLD
jgi:hypothetical protein